MGHQRSRVLLWAALSGVLWALAWPGIGGATPLAFVAWLPLLHAERSHDRRTAGRKRAFAPYAMLAAFIWNASCSWWFFAVEEPLATRMVSGLAPMCVNTLLMTVPWWLKRITRHVAGARTAALAFIAYWLAFEHLHHAWDLQWPWFSLGNVFGSRPAWVQWYELTGMLGGSAWILLVNTLLDRIVVHGSERSAFQLRRVFPVSLVLLLPWSWSAWRFATYREDGQPSVEVVLVQPCVDPYTEKFGGMDALEQVDRMLALAAPAMTDSTALVVLPETALQEGAFIDMSGTQLEFHGLWENAIDQARSVRRLRNFQQLHPNAALLAGMSSEFAHPPGVSPSLAARPMFADDDLPPGGQRWYTAYNAALFLPGHGPSEVYHKSKLVAGVESMPFERILGGLDALAVDLGGMTGSLGIQEEREVLHDPGHDLQLVPAICYESVFGEHVAQHVRNGGELIAVITNDAWWGDTPGYHQHLTFSSLRAIETRRDVVRSANTGISAFIDQRGVVRGATTWWERIAIRDTVHANTKLTFFTKAGDVIGRAALWIALSLLLFTFVKRWIARGSFTASPNVDQDGTDHR